MHPFTQKKSKKTHGLIVVELAIFKLLAISSTQFYFIGCYLFADEQNVYILSSLAVDV